MPEWLKLAEPLLLQLGHGFEAVETTGDALAAPNLPELQLGHGFEAVETVGLVLKAGRWPEVLQLGHGFEAVETPPVVASKVPEGQASIGPRL